MCPCQYIITDVLQATLKATHNRKKKAKKNKKKQGSSFEEQEGQESNSNPRPLTQIGNYTPYSKAVLKRAKCNFRDLILTVDVFPSDKLRTSFGQRAWKAASDAMPVEFSKSSYLFTLSF